MKRVLTAVLALILLLGSCAFAESASPVLDIQTISFDGHNLETVVYTTSATMLRPVDFHMQVGKNEAAVDAISSFADAPMARTWIFAVDMYAQHQLDNMKSLASALIEQMDEGDNGAIVTAESTQIALTSDKNELTAQVEALKRNNDNSFNGAINRVLEYLKTSNDTADRCCVVLITNGVADRTGASLSDLKDQAAKSRVTVYTVAFVNDSNRVSAATFNDFHAIARASRGGMATDVLSSTFKRGTTLEGVVGAIMENESKFFVLSTAVDPNWTDCNSVSLTMDKSGFSLESSLDFTQAEIAQLQGILDELAQPEESIDGEGEPVDVDDTITNGANEGDLEGNSQEFTEEPIIVPDDKPWYQELNSKTIGLIVCGVCALLLIILTICLLAKRKKPVVEDVEDIPTDIIEYQVSLERLGPQGGVFTATLRSSLIIGRQAGNADLVIPDDPKISRIHAKLIFQNGGLYLADQNSTNSTLLNNQPVSSQPIELHQNDVITVGMTSLRITWS